RKNIENNKVVDKNVIELSELNAIEPKEVVDMKKEVEDGTNDESVRSVKEEITGDGIEELVEMPRSQPVGYYLKHEINEKLCNTPKMGHSGKYVRECYFIIPLHKT
ncbi:hypothetical protein Tco_0353150, partial [Tanacetum coccineum]